jgi:hypothetical protein
MFISRAEWRQTKTPRGGVIKMASVSTRKNNTGLWKYGAKTNMNGLAVDTADLTGKKRPYLQAYLLVQFIQNIYNITPE